jgi:hypothetical protein
MTTDSNAGGGGQEACGDDFADYRAEYAPQAEELCRQGYDEGELAAFFQVNDDDVEHWAAAQPEFALAIEAGKQAIADAVEVSLVRRALGYYRLKTVITRRGNRFDINEFVDPNVNALIEWLRARGPESFRRRCPRCGFIPPP